MAIAFEFSTFSPNSRIGLLHDFKVQLEVKLRKTVERPFQSETGSEAGKSDKNLYFAGKVNLKTVLIKVVLKLSEAKQGETEEIS